MNDEIQFSVMTNPERMETTIMARFNDSMLVNKLPDIVFVKAVNGLVEKYVEDKYQEISSKIDTEAIAKQLALAVTAALAEKTLKEALSNNNGSGNTTATMPTDLGEGKEK